MIKEGEGGDHILNNIGAAHAATIKKNKYNGFGK